MGESKSYRYGPGAPCLDELERDAKRAAKAGPGRMRCAGCGIPLDNPADFCPECAATKEAWSAMLEALRGLLKEHEAFARRLRSDIVSAGAAPIARAAIAKAEGR